MPVYSYHLLNTSGFSASPAMVQYFRLDRSYFPTPSLMKNRNIVGGAQNVVILYFSMIFSMFSGMNLSKSYTKTQVPIAI